MIKRAVRSLPTPFLLSTKLQRPQPAAAEAPRPRVLERLAPGLRGSLVLVSAPAGYGKTTAVNHWLDTLDLPIAWVSLDERDGDLATFVGYLLAAVRSVYPDAGETTRLLVKGAVLPSPNRLADTLLQDLAALPDPLMLALDDYHTIRSLDVHTVMSRVVQYLPADFHLVVRTRVDPPWPLERLRSRQQVVELNSRDLRFTLDEANQWLGEMLGPATAAETAALLQESSEGWAAGLQLAALSLRGQRDPASAARRIAHSNSQLVIDYLAAEVLQGLPDAERAFLFQTSLLDRFSASLCDALRGDDGPQWDGGEMLQTVRRSNLFLAPLDEEGVWFRYHPLFRNLLRMRLPQAYGEAAVRAMHARASAWFAAQGLVDEAVTHALQAGDVEGAATLVEDNVHPALDRETWRLVERWIKLLPTTTLSRPRLLLAQGWLSFIRYQVTAIDGLIDAADEAIAGAATPGDPKEETLAGELAALRSATAYPLNDIERVFSCAEEALRLLHPDMQYVMGQAQVHYIIGLHATGRSEEAVEFAQRQLGLHRERPALMLRVLLGLCSVHYESANVPAMHAAASTFIHVAREAGLGLSIGWSQYALGWPLYQRNDLARAEACFRDLASIAPVVHGRGLLDGYTGLALTFLAQGRSDEALAAVGTLREHLVERSLMALAPVVDSLQQHILLAHDPQAALAADYRAPDKPVSIEFWEQPALTYVRTVLAQGAPGELARADGLLAERRAEATKRHAQRTLIEINALQALVSAAQGNEDKALAFLRQAVAAAAPGGVLRLMTDCGPGLIPLLQKLAGEGVAPGYVRQVMGLLTATDALPIMPIQDAGPVGRASEAPVALLTNREIDVLILLAERLSDKEIAERLVLSPETVKKHTLSIYRKLGVHNRRAAALQARSLGLA